MSISWRVIMYTFLLDMELERKSEFGWVELKGRKKQYVFRGKRLGRSIEIGTRETAEARQAGLQQMAGKRAQRI